MVPVTVKIGAPLAVIAAASGSTGIWYFSDLIFGGSSVSSEKDQNIYGGSSIGKKYGDYFLSARTNKNIWKKRFDDNKNRFTGTPKLKDKFRTVTEGYSYEDSNTTALNKVCYAAYTESSSNNLSNSEPTDSEKNKFFKTNVWEFCGLGKIVTLDKDTKNYPENSLNTNQIGGVESEKKLFVSTKHKDNNWFWDLKSKDFWSNTTPLVGKDKGANEFKKLKDSANYKKGTDIRTICEEVYANPTTDDSDSKNKDDALTFCSIQMIVGGASAN